MPSRETDENVSSKCNGSKQRTTSSCSSSSEDSVFLDAYSDPSGPPPLDGGYGWMIVVSSFLTNMISDGISFSFGIMYTELLNYFEESRSFTSLVGSIFYGTGLMGGPLASALATKYGCRKVQMFGGVVAAVGCMLSAFSNSIEMLCLTFGVITGLGLSMGYVTAIVIVAFYFEKKRALATGLAVCGSGIGTFLFAPLTEILINIYGWRGTMIIWSGIILNLVVCGALLRPLQFTPQERKQRALQKFEKISRTVSYSSFSNTGKTSSRNASVGNTESFDSDSNHEEDNMEHCHSQIQIPTFVKDKNVPIPVEILKAKNKNKFLAEYIQNYPEESKSARLAGVEKKSSVIDKDERQDCVVVIENGKEQVKLIHKHDAEKKPKGSCLKKSPQSTDSVKITAVTASKTHSKQKHVSMNSYLPLYRKDLFFRGNLSRVPYLVGQTRATSCPELYRSTDEDSESESSDDEWESDLWKYLHFSKHVKRVLKTLFDPSILVDRFYLIFAVSNFILYFWYDVPYIFMADRAIEFGINESKGAFLISILGIVNTFGQIIYGVIGDWDINLSVLYGVTLSVCGLSVMLVPLFTTFLPLAILSGMFGLLISVNYALSSVILVEYLGLDKLPNAYGLMMLIQGIGNLLGPPAAGALYDHTGSYDTTFYMAGAFVVVSGLMLLVVPCGKRCSSRHQCLRQAVTLDKTYSIEVTVDTQLDTEPNGAATAAFITEGKVDTQLDTEPNGAATAAFITEGRADTQLDTEDRVVQKEANGIQDYPHSTLLVEENRRNGV